MTSTTETRVTGAKQEPHSDRGSNPGLPAGPDNLKLAVTSMWQACGLRKGHIWVLLRPRRSLTSLLTSWSKRSTKCTLMQKTSQNPSTTSYVTMNSPLQRPSHLKPEVKPHLKPKVKPLLKAHQLTMKGQNQVQMTPQEQMLSLDLGLDLRSTVKKATKRVRSDLSSAVYSARMKSSCQSTTGA